MPFYSFGLFKYFLKISSFIVFRVDLDDVYLEGFLDPQKRTEKWNYVVIFYAKVNFFHRKCKIFNTQSDWIHSPNSRMPAIKFFI